MFDVRDIISAASHAQFSDHAAAIHYAVEAGWLTEDGLKLPDEVARRGQETNVSQT
jgi:hypothetical protein